jgi:putative copper export protein
MVSYRLVAILHLLGASVWIGGHLVLCLAVLPRALRARDPEPVRTFEAGFERLGIPALLVQVATGLWLATAWVPDVGSWFRAATPAATLVLVKLGLLAATVALAVDARLRMVPRLDAARLPALAWHIVAVTVISVAFLVCGVGIRTGGLW